VSITLLAGVVTADITPPVGIAHANWGAQTHERAASIDLPLKVNVLALSDGTTTSLIVDIDTCWLWEPLATQCQEAIMELTGLPAEAIRLSYSHTHSGPAGSGNQSWVAAGVEMFPGYQENLRRTIAGASWEAINSLRPVRIAAAEGSSSISVNRRYARPGDGEVVVGRNWEGIRDPKVSVLRLDTLDGEPYAAVVGFGCHPITVGPDNDKITPDYPGVTREVVNNATGATTLFLQGGAGDIGPVRGVAADGINQYKRLGTILGLEAAKLWWEADPIVTTESYVETVESGAPLALYADTPTPDIPAAIKVERTIVEVPVKRADDADALAARLETHKSNLARLRKEGGSDEDIKRETMLAKRASMRENLNRRVMNTGVLPIEVFATIIGDEIALIALSVELFAATGLAIQAASPFPTTIVSGYTGPNSGYLPTTDSYKFGGYEIEVTPYVAESADFAEQAAIDLLNSLASTK
jgi:hypothetical protein